ncbi:hypothetical protein [Mesorhizobium sp.]|uniref:hypothetical protein n=1 Tax=Mesorhizobium sp. TaxID=1871066 RepID=UPI0025DE9D04|nr:hypothetical protein [Mesorhizobium sp.]
MIEDKFKCRVCGLSQYPDLPWGEDGRQPSFNICDCCGVEFGYGDDGLENCLRLRRHWVEVERCRWFSPRDRPADWDLPAQIRGIPKAYKSDDDEKLINAHIDAGEPPLRGLSALSAIEKSTR